MPKITDRNKTATISTAQDDNEETKLKQQLQISETKLALLLDSLPGMAYRCKIQENFTFILEYASKGSFDLLGFTPEELVIHNWNTIERMTIKEDLVRVRKELCDAIKEHRLYKIMYRVTTPPNCIKWIWEQGVATYNNEGLPTHIDGILMDVSAQKMREAYLQQENEYLLENCSSQCSLGYLVGMSKNMQQVYSTILKAARCNSNVIVYGETGTGKDLVARTIHELSGSKGNYVPVNCGAIPEELLESEFFGSKKGAFSGANSDRVGYIEAANDGTLFLDEIGELNLKLQVKLLRVLENKQYIRVGDTYAQKSNFRLITATNRDLTRMVKDGTMRSDFFYRIHILAIYMPALREHMEDMPLLIKNFAKSHPEFGSRVATIPHEVKILMEQYSWPGNIRELYNFLERYLVFGEVKFTDQNRTEFSIPKQLDLDAFNAMDLKETLRKIEKSIISNYLKQYQQRTDDVAKALGMNRRALQRKMKMYNLYL